MRQRPIICTHDGKFHADDVLAVAILLKIFPGSQVVRTRDEVAIRSADIVVDVGQVYTPNQLRFDHHQRSGAGYHASGIKYSGLGLIWKQYGVQLCGGQVEAWKRIDNTFVSTIDAHDNGQTIARKNSYDVTPQLFDYLFSLFNLAYDEDGDDYEQFMTAVEVGGRVLDRLIKTTISTVKSESMLIAAYANAEDKRCLVLDNYIPLSKPIDSMSELLYAVYPSKNRGWMLQAVNIPGNRYISRKPLPEPWRGLQGSQLKEVTDVPDAYFCHATGFISGADSKEGALALLDLALKS